MLQSASRGDVCSGGRSAPRGGSALGGVSTWGVSAPRGGVSQHALRQTPPPVDRILDRLVKILPWPNFVAAGDKRQTSQKVFVFSQFEWTLMDIDCKCRGSFWRLK